MQCWFHHFTQEIVSLSTYQSLSIFITLIHVVMVTRIVFIAVMAVFIVAVWWMTFCQDNFVD